MSSRDVAGPTPGRSPLALSIAGKAAEVIPLILLVTAVPRALGPAEYGRLALAISIVTLGSAALSLGGPVLLTRFVPAAEPRQRSAVARALGRRLALSRGLQLASVVLAAAALVALLPDRFPPLVTLLVVGALALDVAATLCFQIALGLGRDAAWAFRYALQNAVLVVAVLVLAFAADTRWAIAGVTIAAAAAFGFGAAAVLPGLIGAERGARVPPGALRFGLIQGIASFFVQLVHRGGVAAVALLASSRETGFAGLTIGLALAGTYAVWQAFSIQLPRLTASTADPHAAEGSAEKLAWTSLLVVGPAAIVAAALLEPALPLLAGDHFAGAEASLGPALALIPLAPLSALLAQTTALRLRADVRLWGSASGAVVFLVVAAATVPSFGAAGATAALLAGTLVAALATVALLPGSAGRRVVLGSIGAAAATLATAEVVRGEVAGSLLAQVAALAVAAALGLLALRRVVLLVAAVLPPRAEAAPHAATARVGDESETRASVTLLVAAHNEAGHVERVLEAIEHLDYPEDRLTVVLIDDGSDDGTGDILALWAGQHRGASAMRLEERVGKPGALNHGLRLAPPTELVGVCDADHEPHPDWLRRVVTAFADDTVGAAGAYLRPVNANASLVARYAAVEAWVTQLVTSAARNRLDLNPPMLGGGSVYRRSALDEIGGFPGGLDAEDAGATISLTRRGWRTRFVQDAIVDNHVVEHGRQYWHQHVRWARTGYETVRLQRGSDVPLGRRLEAWMVSAGYSDRFALLAAAAFAAAGMLPIWVPLAYLGAIGLAVVVAIARGGAIRRLPLHLAAMVAMLLVDTAATVVAGVQQVRRRPLQWRTRHAGLEDG